MAVPPDPAGVDWVTVAAWGAGIGTGIGSIIGATILAIRKALKVARDNPAATITREETKVVTTDSVAMHELAGSIEALNLTVGELQALIKSEIADRTKEREDRDREEEFAMIARREAEKVQREAEEEREERRRPGRT